MKDVKNMFGGSSSSSIPKSGGNVLGGTAAPTGGSVPAPPSRFTVTFAAESLGMNVAQHPTGSALVNSVVENSEAARAGVTRGLRIVAIQGQPVLDYEAFVAVIGGVGRPVQLTFEGEPGPKASSSSSSSKKSSSSSSLPSFMQTKPEAAPPSAAEQAARREAALKAAQSRGTAWDKKLSNNRSEKAQRAKADRESRMAELGASEQPMDVNSESARMYEEARAREAGQEIYNVQIGSTTAARAAVNAAAVDSTAQAQAAQGNAPSFMAPPPGGGGGGGQAPPAIFSGTGHTTGTSHAPGGPVRPPELSTQTSADAALAAQLQQQQEGSGGGAPPPYEEVVLSPEDEAKSDEALALLASHPPDVALKCVSICVKLLANLAKKFDDEKFHRVRLANKAIQEKVGAVSGGIEVMLAAGFELSAEDDETVLMCVLIAHNPHTPLD